MNCISKETVDNAKIRILADEDLTKSLKEFHRRKGNLPTADRGKTFVKWLDGMIQHIADMIPAPATPDRIYEGMKVQSIGDAVALKVEDLLVSKKGVRQTDTNCYVEEGGIHSAIWINGEDAVAANNWAEFASGYLTAKGYAVDLWVDEEDASEVTVNASIDFDIYVKGEGN